MATKQPKAEQAETQVVNHGDVTERTAPVVLNDLIEISPMSELPESHKSLAVSYPTAKGFTQESGSIALHF